MMVAKIYLPMCLHVLKKVSIVGEGTGNQRNERTIQRTCGSVATE